MKKNENMIDRLIRIGLSLALFLIIATKIVTGIPAMMAGVAAVVLFATGTVGICGIYSLFHLSTCKVRRQLD